MKVGLVSGMSRRQVGRAALARDASAEVEHGLDETEQRHQQHRPADHERDGVGPCQHNAATAQSPRDRVQDRKAEDGEGHEQACRERARQQADQARQQGARDGGGEEAGGE